MSQGINKVLLIGNLGKDPEIRITTNNNEIARFSIATSESWKDKNTGERKEVVEWHNIVAYQQLAKICREYLHKGSKVYIEGKIQTRKWQDKESSQDKYITEIIADKIQMLDVKKKEETNSLFIPIPDCVSKDDIPITNTVKFDDVPF